jgi:hypothetical protein
MTKTYDDFERPKGKGGTILGIVLGLIAVAGFGVLGYAWKLTADLPGIDDVTLCPDSGPAGHLAFLIDMTDPVSKTQVQSARELIALKIEKAPVGTRVSLSTVSPDGTLRDQVFHSICKPPNGEDSSSINSNPRMIAARYKEQFTAPVEQALGELFLLEEATSSPIMEALQEFITQLPGFTTDSDVPRELVLMTDLVQHTDMFSFYRQHDWIYFRSIGGPERLAKNMRGVEVTILRVPRTTVSSSTVDEFWLNYFDTQGAASVVSRSLGDL